MVRNAKEESDCKKEFKYNEISEAMLPEVENLTVLFILS